MKRFTKTALAVLAVCSVAHVGTAEASPLTGIIGDSAEAAQSAPATQVGFEILGLTDADLDPVKETQKKLTVPPELDKIDNAGIGQDVYDGVNSIYPKVVPEINDADMKNKYKKKAKKGTQKAVEGVLGHKMNKPPKPTIFDPEPELKEVQKRVDDAIADAKEDVMQ